jgi:hypothetical protein
MEERKRRDFFYYVCGGSHTHVFSIGQERPLGYRPRVQPSLRKAHSYGNFPYNLKHTLIFMNMPPRKEEGYSAYFIGVRSLSLFKCKNLLPSYTS